MSLEPSTLQNSPPGNRFRDWLELVRLPNVFTAVADPLAGALVAGAGWRDNGSVLNDIGKTIVIMLASACFYSGGLILNDWHDYRRDLVERPQRPLPSGRISRWRALTAAITLLAAGQLLASAMGPAAGGVGLLLVVCILMYDILMKDIPIAPALMGAARGLNLLLGMVLFEAADAPRLYLVIALGLYVLGVTVFARRETGLSRKDQLLLGVGFTAGALLLLALLRLFFAEEAPFSSGAIWLALLTGVVGYTMTQAILTPSPVRIQRAVKTAIFGIILFDASIVAFGRGLPLSLLVAALVIPAIWFGKRLYST